MIIQYYLLPNSTVSNRYTHNKDIKYHNTGNGWTLATATAWENSVNGTVGGVGTLTGPRALKSLNSIERIQDDGSYF